MDRDEILQELGNFRAEQVPLDWDVSRKSLDGRFVTKHYRQIYKAVYQAIRQHFPSGEADWEGHGPWEAPSVIENDYTFEVYVEQVARPESHFAKPWDRLMKYPERTHVLAAVVFKMLHDHVFSELLFGASDEEAKDLATQDTKFLRENTYKRTSLRAKLIEVLLDRTGNGPQFFWASVDTLAYKIVVQLYPALLWGSESPTMRTHVKDVLLRGFFQAIHSVVAISGHLAVQIRRISKEIITFEWPVPGDSYCPSRRDVDDSIYQRTKKAADEADAILAAQSEPAPQRRTKVMVSITPKIEIYHAKPSYRKCLWPAMVLNDTRLSNENVDQHLSAKSLVEHSRYAKRNYEMRALRQMTWRHKVVFVLLILCLLLYSAQARDREVGRRRLK